MHKHNGQTEGFLYTGGCKYIVKKRLIIQCRNLLIMMGVSVNVELRMKPKRVAASVIINDIITYCMFEYMCHVNKSLRHPQCTFSYFHNELKKKHNNYIIRLPLFINLIKAKMCF